MTWAGPVFSKGGLGKANALRDTEELVNLTNTVLKFDRLKSLGKLSLPKDVRVLSRNWTTVLPRVPSDTVPDS